MATQNGEVGDDKNSLDSGRGSTLNPGMVDIMQMFMAEN